jgi:hypothetical protein
MAGGALSPVRQHQSRVRMNMIANIDAIAVRLQKVCMT